METHKCECGGEIVFENKKTFTNPEQKNGICKKCKMQYTLIGKELKKKGGGK